MEFGIRYNVAENERDVDTGNHERNREPDICLYPSSISHIPDIRNITIDDIIVTDDEVQEDEAVPELQIHRPNRPPAP